MMNQADTGEGALWDLESQVRDIQEFLSSIAKNRYSKKWQQIFGVVTLVKPLGERLTGVDIRQNSGHVKAIFNTTSGIGPAVRVGDKIKASGWFTIYSPQSHLLEIQFKVDSYTTFPSLSNPAFRKYLKKPIPRFIGKIVLVTSKSSQALQDFKVAVGYALPEDKTLLVPVDLMSVEGICEGIRYADEQKYDAMIILRGGGSGIDIFNDARIAALVKKCKTYVISAIGHESDKLLIESAADFRAPTPSLAGVYLRDHIRQQPAKRPIPGLSELSAVLEFLFKAIRFAFRHWLATTLVVVLIIYFKGCFQ